MTARFARWTGSGVIGKKIGDFFFPYQACLITLQVFKLVHLSWWAVFWPTFASFGLTVLVCSVLYLYARHLDNKERNFYDHPEQRTK